MIEEKQRRKKVFKVTKQDLSALQLRLKFNLMSQRIPLKNIIQKID